LLKEIVLIVPAVSKVVPGARTVVAGFSFVVAGVSSTVTDVVIADRVVVVFFSAQTLSSNNYS